MIVSEAKRGLGVAFERVRRVTGYLTALDTCNDAKRHEIKDRVAHDKYIDKQH